MYILLRKISYRDGWLLPAKLFDIKKAYFLLSGIKKPTAMTMKCSEKEQRNTNN